MALYTGSPQRRSKAIASDKICSHSAILQAGLCFLNLRATLWLCMDLRQRSMSYRDRWMRLSLFYRSARQARRPTLLARQRDNRKLRAHCLIQHASP
jgi:hypothetical protein